MGIPNNRTTFNDNTTNLSDYVKEKEEYAYNAIDDTEDYINDIFNVVTSSVDDNVKALASGTEKFVSDKLNQLGMDDLFEGVNDIINKSIDIDLSMIGLPIHIKDTLLGHLKGICNLMKLRFNLDLNFKFNFDFNLDLNFHLDLFGWTGIFGALSCKGIEKPFGFVKNKIPSLDVNNSMVGAMSNVLKTGSKIKGGIFKDIVEHSTAEGLSFFKGNGGGDHILNALKSNTKLIGDKVNDTTQRVSKANEIVDSIDKLDSSWRDKTEKIIGNKGVTNILEDIVKSDKVELDTNTVTAPSINSNQRLFILSKLKHKKKFLTTHKYIKVTT